MARTLAACAFLDHPARSAIISLSFIWFTGIELVLGLTTWVHFLPVPLNSIFVITIGKGYVRTLAYQAIHPFGVDKLVQATSRG